MEKVLYINACVRPESRTDALARHLLSRLCGDVEEVKVFDEALPLLDRKTLAHRDEAGRNGDFDDQVYAYARQFRDADTVVVAAPYWDLMFPAQLKRYFEAVTVTGVTFFYTPEGYPQGLCKGKRLYYVTTAGGPITVNFGYDYVKAMAQGFYGIGDVRCIKAEFLDVIGADVAGILEKAKQEIEDLL